jgi:hypothetical protein
MQTLSFNSVFLGMSKVPQKVKTKVYVFRTMFLFFFINYYFLLQTISTFVLSMILYIIENAQDTNKMFCCKTLRS